MNEPSIIDESTGLPELPEGREAAEEEERIKRLVGKYPPNKLG